MSCGLEIRAMLPINLRYAIFTEVSEAKEETQFISGGLDRNESTHQSPLILELILQRGHPWSPSLLESIQKILAFFFMLRTLQASKSTTGY